MACKGKARLSSSAHCRTRHRDRRQATVGAPAALSETPGAPWSHLLLFAVFYSFLLASSPASLTGPSTVTQSDAHAFPLLTHDGARSVALILYLIGFLTCCARATEPRKAVQPLVTVGDVAPPATTAQRADASPRYTSRVAALYDADCFLLWGAGGASAALATVVGLARLLFQAAPVPALARCAYPAVFIFVMGASSYSALRSFCRLHAACSVGPRVPHHEVSPQQPPSTLPPRPRHPARRHCRMLCAGAPAPFAQAPRAYLLGDWRPGCLRCLGLAVRAAAHAVRAAAAHNRLARGAGGNCGAVRGDAELLALCAAFWAYLLFSA